MTDRLAALELLADEDSPARVAALQHFHDTYSSQPLAMLKWLDVQVREGGVRVAGMEQRESERKRINQGGDGTTGSREGGGRRWQEPWEMK
jgi:hypothetical protein